MFKEHFKEEYLIFIPIFILSPNFHMIINTKIQTHLTSVPWNKFHDDTHELIFVFAYFSTLEYGSATKIHPLKKREFFSV